MIRISLINECLNLDSIEISNLTTTPLDHKRTLLGIFRILDKMSGTDHATTYDYDQSMRLTMLSWTIPAYISRDIYDILKIYLTHHNMQFQEE